MVDQPDKRQEFYRAFEDRFRGGRDIIRQRLTVYGPIIEAAHRLAGNPHAIDVGCGRGEWLELLRDHSVDAIGVDLDEPMLAACHALGLRALNADALSYLQQQADNSAVIVSGFHIAEHLPFDILQSLIAEAHRVLCPGGFLILETPNPENLRVSSLTFHLDPTHQKPIPPDLLGFLAQYYGFETVRTLRLQEDPAIATSDSVPLEVALTGASPDYAIVGQKAGAVDGAAELANLFGESVGLTPESLYRRFQSQLNEAHDATARALSAQQQLRAELRVLEDRHETSLKALDQERQLREQLAAALEQQRLAVHVLMERSSISMWRTLHTGAWAWLTLKRGSRPDRTMRTLLTHARLWLRQRPKLMRFMLKTLTLAPPLERRLMAMRRSDPPEPLQEVLIPVSADSWQTDVTPAMLERWTGRLQPTTQK